MSQSHSILNVHKDLNLIYHLEFVFEFLVNGSAIFYKVKELWNLIHPPG